MKSTHLSIPMLVLLAAIPACHKAANSSAHVQGTPRTDDVLQAWRNAGLAVDAFTTVQPPPYSATYCEHGFVRRVLTMVCEYSSDESLKHGTQQVKEEWARSNAHTGVILQAKRTTMMAVDREHREPSGKTISEMAKAFRKL